MSASTPAAPEDLFTRLDELGIAHSTIRHEPVFTVGENRALRGSIPGGHCKNLFLKNRKNAYWLVVCLEDARIDLKDLGGRIGAGPPSFGSAERLMDVLGILPGTVTPFALINDHAQRVQPVLQARMLEFSPLNYHPLRNDRTTAIAPEDLVRFIEHCGHKPVILDF
ncbi:MAG: prolyl-tRNA synthetase associated domain-containing protein [Alphaproteobacteria bacterium]|nr:prolyl-tRNA synthetase associated domain-containing protein [Alphaproteobacteria bacterium]